MNEDPFFVRAEDKFYKRSTSKVLRVIRHQTGKKPDIDIDRKRIALRPGKRISKNGKVYWETRKNRSDVIPKPNKL